MTKKIQYSFVSEPFQWSSQFQCRLKLWRHWKAHPEHRPIGKRVKERDNKTKRVCHWSEIVSRKDTELVNGIKISLSDEKNINKVKKDRSETKKQRNEMKSYEIKMKI